MKWRRRWWNAWSLQFSRRPVKGLSMLCDCGGVWYRNQIYHCTGVLTRLSIVLPAPDLQKPPTIAFHWDFFGSFFCVRVPDIISKLKNKKTASWKNISIKFYIPQCTVDDIRKNTTVTQWQPPPHDMCLCTLQINRKSVPGAVQYYGLRMDYLRKTKFPPIYRKVRT